MNLISATDPMTKQPVGRNLNGERHAGKQWGRPDVLVSDLAKAEMCPK
jgi:hypothetical protein